MAFLFRLGFAVFWMIVFAGVAYVLILIFNRGIQFLARQMGYEVGDFFHWIGSKFKRKKGKRKMKSPPNVD